MLGNGNCSDDMNFTASVFLVVEAIGSWVIDVENNTWPEGWDNDEEENDEEDDDMPDNDMPDNGGIIVDADHTVEENHPEIKDFESKWYHVYFTPTMFNVTIFNERDFYYSNVTDFYYRNMTDLYVNNMTEGYCMPILDYWNNETVGCPCNDTWNTTGYYNSSTNSFMGGRQIIPGQCANDSCREMMFLNDTMKYANVRINITECKNGSVLKTVEFTKMSYEKDMGYTYGVQDIGYIFGAWKQNEEVHSLNGENDTLVKTPEVALEMPLGSDNDTYDRSDVNGSYGLPMSTMITIIFIFLLGMIHPN